MSTIHVPSQQHLEAEYALFVGSIEQFFARSKSAADALSGSSVALTGQIPNEPFPVTMSGDAWASAAAYFVKLRKPEPCPFPVPPSIS